MYATGTFGAAADLLVDGRNGVALRDNGPEAWRQAMRTASADPDRLVAMGHESAHIADAWRADSDPIECVKKLLRPS